MKKRSENAGANENLSGGFAAIPGIAPRVAPRIVGFVFDQVVRGHSENGNFVFREWNFQFRELLREYPGTLRELREWPFHSESVFPEIGVVSTLLTIGCSRVAHRASERNLCAVESIGHTYSRALWHRVLWDSDVTTATGIVTSLRPEKMTYIIY